MVDVAAWLRGLGLQQYAQAFAVNDIDGRTLPDLTESDLKVIGVTSVGHRRKLVHAIAALRSPGDPTAGQPTPTPTPAAAPTIAAAERRPLTVLYCDLVGSTALSNRLNPEDYRELIRSFHQACVRQVADYDGWVANFIGDCVLAYFGWPRAHEDDAERAARAGLAMVHAVGALQVPGGDALAVRVGMATGSVVVGDLIREGPAQEQSAVGMAPQVAAQLQALAAPNRLVMDELTCRLLGAGFAVEPLGVHAFEGLAQSVTAWTLVGERTVESRFDARRERDAAPMVGRDRELALLKQRWAQACAGEGLAVLLVGEAGIGKSRLVRALLDGCVDPLHRLVRWQCSPYHADSALWPVIQRLARMARLGEEDNPDAALDKLEAIVGERDTALCATLLGLNSSERYGPLEMTPQMLRERTLELLIEQLFDRADPRPSLLVLEDAHWIDPTTLELLERCLVRIDQARMLIVITCRPDNQPRLDGHPSVTSLSLNRLSRASVEAMVRRLGGDNLQPQTLATIATQTDGVPLFVEELTLAVLETGEATIPASLHGSLMARLDRFPEVKEVAQIAACIGREFDPALVHAVADRPDTVAPALDRLVEAELIFRRGDRTHPRYTFKHALVQEAARESLLRDRRQAIHARILEVLLAGSSEASLAILARHAQLAGRVAEAIEFWTQAGDVALAKSAYVEATHCFTSAIELARQSAAYRPDAERRLQELELQVRLGRASSAAHGYGTDLAKRAFERADDILDTVADATHAFRVHYGLWTWNVMQCHIEDSLLRAKRALAVAKPDGSDGTLGFAHRLIGSSHLLMGELDVALTHAELALQLTSAPGMYDFAGVLGVDARVTIYFTLAWILRLQGLAQRSEDMLREAARVGLSGEVSAKANMHLNCAIPRLFARDFASAAPDVEALLALAEEHRLGMYKSYANVVSSWIALETKAPTEDVIRTFETAVSELSSLGSRIHLPFFRTVLASGLARVGRRDEALREVDRAIVESEKTKQAWFAAELWRVRGELLSADGVRSAAEAARNFEQALTLARSSGARLWELRAAVSLSRLWADRGERDRARPLLAPLLAWFSDGLDTADLADARTLLDSLSERPSAERSTSP